MSQNQADSQTLEAKLREIDERTKRNEDKIKGLSGQMGLIRNKVGVPKPGTTALKPIPSQSEPSESVFEPAQASKGHSTYSWMKGCPGCGGEKNADYKGPPNVYCKTCGVPMGRVENDAELKAISQCWNCEGKTVKTTPPKEVLF